ncbi:hypothetical protein BLNAU_5324 [Blattamonas nauphoetae]|uniref:Uncharacterized protein n=1 Tax=Blattamonas nauphoetae TaxID=2049346 RepID=A0ABQ9Y7W4_9EUKA|nr:hypothetical protein BLNAU_5324 [Blattamonas nauphoetae]
MNRRFFFPTIAFHSRLFAFRAFLSSFSIIRSPLLPTLAQGSPCSASLPSPPAFPVLVLVALSGWVLIISTTSPSVSNPARPARPDIVLQMTGEEDGGLLAHPLLRTEHEDTVVLPHSVQRWKR